MLPDYCAFILCVNDAKTPSIFCEKYQLEQNTNNNDTFSNKLLEDVYSYYKYSESYFDSECFDTKLYNTKCYDIVSPDIYDSKELLLDNNNLWSHANICKDYKWKFLYQFEKHMKALGCMEGDIVCEFQFIRKVSSYLNNNKKYKCCECELEKDSEAKYIITKIEIKYESYLNIH